MKYKDPSQIYPHLSPQLLQYFRSKIRHWFENNGREFPWRETKNPYEIIVAEILLQQTDAQKVQKIYPTFIKAFPNTSILSKAERFEVRLFIDQIGLDYRVDRIIKLANIIENEFNGNLPRNKEELLSLPGVGPYIANALLATAFNKRVAVVDTNVVRIFKRFFAFESTRPRPRTDPAIWSFAHKLLPRQSAKCKNWNYALLDFAALVCGHYLPKCKICPCFRKCSYFTQLEETIQLT